MKLSEHSYPVRVRCGSQTGTAVRRSTLADDDGNTQHLARNGSTPIMQPRSLVQWDGRFSTSTADRALEPEATS